MSSAFGDSFDAGDAFAPPRGTPSATSTASSEASPTALTPSTSTPYGPPLRASPPLPPPMRPPGYIAADDDSFSSQAPISAPESPSTPQIYAGAQGLSPGRLGFSHFSREPNGKVGDGVFKASDGPILPSVAEMEPEEGFTL